MEQGHIQNTGYEKSRKRFEKRAIDDMKHAEKLIGRILFMEGIPIVSQYRVFPISAKNIANKTFIPTYFSFV